MFKKFETKELVFLSLIGALEFVVAFAVGLGIVAATGIPASGGLATNLFVVFILATGLLVVRKFGAALHIVLVHMLLALPTASIGPPGIYKVAIGLIFAFVVDTILCLGRYKGVFYYIALTMGFIVFLPLFLYSLILLGLPGAENLSNLLIPAIGIYIFEALLGTYLARLFYNKKLRDLNLIKQIQNK